MNVLWLGQAGLLIEACGLRILIDPYLSDSVAAVYPTRRRRVPVDERFFARKPDLIVCTHDHLDHTDPATLRHYLSGEGRIIVLAPGHAYERVKTFGGDHRYILFERHTEWTEGDVRLIAVRAVHSDPQAIGVVLEGEGHRLYMTGDTLYSTELPDDLRPLGHIDVIFLPVNGEGNNMNHTDAARLCAQLDCDAAVPLHWGLLDDLDGRDWNLPRQILPEIYCEIPLNLHPKSSD